MKAGKFLSRMLCVCIAALLLVSGLTACTNGDTQDTTEPIETTTEKESNVEIVTTEPEIVPAEFDRYFENEVFNILTRDADPGAVWATVDVWSESMSVELVPNAVYMRNLKVFDKYGIEINQIKKTSLAKLIQTNSAANGSEYDAYSINIQTLARSSVSGYLSAVDNSDYLDYTNPWWDQEMIESIALIDSHYLLTGDINIMDNYSSWLLAFNKEMATIYNHKDLYDLVNTKEWTLSKLMEICTGITEDLDGNQVLTHSDRWGLVDSRNSSIAFFQCSGEKIVDKDADGKLSNKLNQMTDILGDVWEFFSKPEMHLVSETITGVDNVWTAASECFMNGRALFRATTLIDVPNMRDMTIDFGVLPFPLHSKDQNAYHTPIQESNGTAYAIPSSVSDLDKSAAILEYMGYASVSTLTPAAIDNALLSRYAREPADADMMRLIFETSTADICSIYGWGGTYDSLKTILTAPSNTLSSAIAGMNKRLDMTMSADLTAIKKNAAN